MKQALGILTLSVYLLLLPACNQLQNQNRMTQFQETFRQYAKHLRWGHYSQVTRFMTEAHITTALSQSNRLKDIRISSVEPSSWIVSENSDTINGTINIEYYLTNRAVIRQTSQNQTWHWQDKAWKLDNGLPDLK